MLEELGLGEAPTQAEADVVVFNTCTIREKPDTKFAAYMGEAAARKRERPEMIIAVGGCYAEAQRDRLFSLYPDVDVAFGPGTIPHLGEWLGAGGFGVERGAWGTAPSASSPPRCRCTASARSRHGCRSRWDATRLLLLHRPRGARPRGQPPPGRRARRGHAPRAAGRARGDAARPERQLVWARSAPASTEFGELLRASTPSRASSASDSRARTRRTSAAP